MQKYGIKVWADWNGTGEKDFLWMQVGYAHDEVYLKSFDSKEAAQDWLAECGYDNCSNLVIAPLPDELL